jgi:hypothetical protein
MPSSNWSAKSQSLFGKRIVGVERDLKVSRATDEKTIINGLIMDIYNIFISQKLAFDKKNLPPLTIDYRFSERDVLFVYAITNPQDPDPISNLYLLGLAQRAKKNQPLDGIKLVLAPGKQATSAHGEAIAGILDVLRSPYAPGMLQVHEPVKEPTVEGPGSQI